jgi:hypothetical protein
MRFVYDAISIFSKTIDAHQMSETFHVVWTYNARNFYNVGCDVKESKRVSKHIKQCIDPRSMKLGLFIQVVS